MFLPEQIQRWKLALKERQHGVYKPPDALACIAEVNGFDKDDRDRERTASIATHEVAIKQNHAITMALQRIEKGVYGICLKCREQIEPERLDALPEAERCFKCSGLPVPVPSK